MENQKNNKGVITLLLVIIVILSALCVFFATGTIGFKSNDIDNNEINGNINDDNNINDQNGIENNDEVDSNDKNDINIQENEKYKTITLSKENESFDLDKLNLNFSGVPTNDGDGYFKYVLNIKYDGKNINSSFFNDKYNYRIWSSNMAADFKVYKIDNIYILISFIAKQCFCDEGIIFNTNGEVLKTFSIAEFSIDGQNIIIRTSDNGQCMGDDWEKHVTEYKFRINDSKLIEQ